MFEKKNYSLILPSYNEYGNLILLIPKILKFYNKKNEIIVIDDNSNDNTYIKLKRKYRKNKNIKIVLRKKLKSLALSIKDGIILAKKNNIIVMDSDFNHRPEDLKKMILLFEKSNADIVCGSRFLRGGSSNNFFRHLSSLLFNFYINFVTGGKITDNLSGFFIIKKNLLSKKLMRSFYGYGEYYIRLLYYLQKTKIKILEFPVKYDLRRYGVSKSRLLKMFILYSIETLKLLFK